MVEYGEILMKWFTAISVLIYPTLLAFHPCYVLDMGRLASSKGEKRENDTKSPSQRCWYPALLKLHMLAATNWGLLIPCHIWRLLEESQVLTH